MQGEAVVREAEVVLRDWGEALPWVLPCWAALLREPTTMPCDGAKDLSALALGSRHPALPRSRWCPAVSGAVYVAGQARCHCVRCPVPSLYEKIKTDCWFCPQQLIVGGGGIEQLLGWLRQRHCSGKYAIQWMCKEMSTFGWASPQSLGSQSGGSAESTRGATSTKISASTHLARAQSRHRRLWCWV